MPRKVFLDRLIKGLLEFDRMLRGEDDFRDEDGLVGVGADIEELEHDCVVVDTDLDGV